MSEKSRTAPRLAHVLPVAAGAVAAGVAAAALAVGLVSGGAARTVPIAGLADAGPLTRWGLPVAELAAGLSAVTTVGLLLMASFLLPGEKGLLAPESRRYARLAAWAALCWVAATALTALFTASDLMAVPVARLTGAQVLDFVANLPQGTTLLLVLIAAAGVAGFARDVVGVQGAAGLLGVAVLALLPPALTGHSASSPNHSLAVTGLGLHLVSVTLWAGGLLAVTMHALRGGRDLAIAASRFSRLALWCFAGTAVSGVASAAARLTEPGQLLTSSYGLLVLAKTAAVIVLGGCGLLHRRRTLAALRAGRPRAFARLAAGEVVVMAAVMGLAVALSRTAPPLVTLPVDPVRDLLGYAMPPELTAARLASLWRLDLLFALLVLVAAVGYAAGVVRLRRRGDAWPVGRSVSWALGLVLVVVFTQSGIATYAPVLFSMHMIQHMGLAMLAPIFLVLGAPVTLALRAVGPAARRGDRGPREWIVAVLHSRVAEIVSHPVVAMVIFVSGSYALYYTSLFEGAMRQPAGHIVMNAHFLASGVLFFWVIIGVDPAPRRLPHLAKLGTLMLTMPFHAFFGISMMMMGKSIASSWYDELDRPWGASVLQDQSVAGGMAWAFSEIPTMIVVITIAAQWALSDHRESRRQDRHADRRGDAELAAYNDYLTRLNERSERQP
ncbi:bifunctional copper resistance protein CopD/cytochrome c oxidase assembly protein [Nonomuraea sp. NN258]|uniref:cytochrome c oxidase assembly protein n=1 Tax=Nonomuraea antri TaxID=2730852 RepID=UPI00156A01EF|nr:cytochrome c oxidase assembly protein [Nonomuraea antri]NRQ32353.1 bifunctional copper resistance protein CopD/cytochrome c oxidase assembly protein [Nonomuraea antri]